ncbi:MAG: hypothetical protein KC422_25425 [Trueperaceae bacterium]|nr:hypothetical protein [Trueperaceae bacterium]
MFNLKTLNSLIFSLVAVSSFAFAQYGMPDFSNFDFTGYMNNQVAIGQASLQSMMAQIMQQRGPEIQAAYQQCLTSGAYCGSFDEYALNYVTTNGFTDGGAWARQNQINIANEQNAWNNVQIAQQGYQNAYGNYTGNYSQNMTEAGNVMMGNSTWTDPYTGANYTLPYLNMQAGQSFYDNASGYFFQYNPYNEQNGQYYMSPDGYTWQPMNPWQAGQ